MQSTTEFTTEFKSSHVFNNQGIGWSLFIIGLKIYHLQVTNRSNNSQKVIHKKVNFKMFAKELT